MLVIRPPLTAGAGPASTGAVRIRSRDALPWLLVGGAVAWNLISLRAETLAVSYLNDSSVHAQMVRFATEQLRRGHLPLTSWFPFLGIGSPMFLHYQSLPSMLAGVLGLVVGAGAAFRWTLYLLLSLWPLSVYCSARLFGAGRAAAAASAAMSPFLASATGIGYEQSAYVWTGFGVWTQLWASLTLPLAWGYSWRAIREGRGYLAAVGLIAVTVALHFETGYLALTPLLLWPFVAGTPIPTRVRRGAGVLAGSLLACAWVIVPLVQQRPWAAVNETLQGGALVNGYGAGRVIGWLATGQLLDHGRIPVVTLCAAVGLLVVAGRSRRDPDARALLVVLFACLLLSFGRATFGSLADLVPGSRDIFFRRFMMGIQLAALLLAGAGATWLACMIRERLVRRSRRLRLVPSPGVPNTRLRHARLAGVRLLQTTIAVAMTIAILAPAWLQLAAYDRRNAKAITDQRRADAAQGAELARLIDAIHAHGGGRVYAGSASNWGVDFTVGAVPVFKYLESRDVDEVGYTLRTASLMSGPESQFDEVVPSDYLLFGIRYLILPSGWSSPVPAALVMRAGPYSLWSTPASGYVRVGRIAGALGADRANLGRRSLGVLHSALAQDGDYVRVAFGARVPSARNRTPRPARRGVAGSVQRETDLLAVGEVNATVTLGHPGVASLSASFDPGWTASVDGRRRPTEMLAPALVGVPVQAGVHRLVFRYRGYPDYALLFALSGLTLAGLLAAPLPRRSAWRSRRPGAGHL